MLEVALRKARKQSIANIDYLQVSILDERFHQESFDAVLAFNVLHLVKHIATTIRRISTLLKPKGYFLSSTECGGENRASFVNVSASILSSMRIVPYIRFFKIDELEGMITKGDFEIVEAANLYTLNQPNHFVAARKL